VTWNIDDPSTIPENIVRETVEKGHVHKVSLGGINVIVHYDEKRKEIDVYKLGKCISLERWKILNKKE